MRFIMETIQSRRDIILPVPSNRFPSIQTTGYYCKYLDYVYTFDVFFLIYRAVSGTCMTFVTKLLNRNIYMIMNPEMMNCFVYYTDFAR